MTGSFGLLPEKWLERYGLLAGLGSMQDDHVRFTRTQVGLLDALLAAQPDVQRDAIFSQACEEVRAFSGIEPASPPAGFRGERRRSGKADRSGPERSRGKARFEDYDLILTTYGTLRRDAADFKDVRFDYVILDEAQAIKNADSASAKAARAATRTRTRASSSRRPCGPFC